MASPPQSPPKTRSKDPSRRARDAALRETRRKLILDAASACFAQEGLERTSMRKIAAEAGATTGAIYPLFPSKEAIYAALLSRSLDGLAQAVAAASEAAAPGWRRFDAACRALVAHYAARPDEIALGFYLTGGGLGRRGLSKPLDKALNDKLTASLAPMTHALSEATGAAAAEAGGLRLDVAATFAALIGALMLHHTGRLSTLGAALDPLIDRQLTLLRAGLTADRPAPDDA